jgi:hypothetical protein
MHIEGKQNVISDIPSRLFGSNPAWKFDTNNYLLTLFILTLPLPHQQPWTVFCPNCTVVMCMILALWTTPFALADWRQLPKVGRHVGEIGALSKPKSNASQDLQHGHKQATMVKEDRYRVAQSLAQSRPLASQLPWPVTPTQPR